MSVQSVPTFPLLSTDEKAIPLIGFGTAEYLFGASRDTLKETIIEAIKLGYCRFDTAAVYQSEQPLGEAISDALRLGLIKSRDELFITSKLWCSDAHHDLVLPALRKTLKNLKLGYVDLYLIHWPLSLKPGKHDFPFKKEDMVPMDIKSVWEAMEECHDIGLPKSIGHPILSSRCSSHTKHLRLVGSTTTPLSQPSYPDALAQQSVITD
ncbi:hypothetical protein GOBAR_AA38858 [Gossypium barbadense]|uniref:NADP-dependent oxidoreductase domain-containing protein n=1 Tax=Gossypium barbadense TaxID=3634 RepID=A0A2P5VSP4_GOSBA|nr:hypothetical protein GOBAR_AA38858 [Gossypium barbadense]